MPINILITFIIGSALGWILIKVTRAPQHLKGLILGCCAAGNAFFAGNRIFLRSEFNIKWDYPFMFFLNWNWTGNLGNLPLIIVPAVCKEEGSPFGDPDVCHANGMAYASLSMAVWSTIIIAFLLCEKWTDSSGCLGWSHLLVVLRIQHCEGLFKQCPWRTEDGWVDWGCKICYRDTQVSSGVHPTASFSGKGCFLRTDASFNHFRDKGPGCFHLLTVDDPYLR